MVLPVGGVSALLGGGAGPTSISGPDTTQTQKTEAAQTFGGINFGTPAVPFTNLLTGAQVPGSTAPTLFSPLNIALIGGVILLSIRMLRNK